MYPKRFDKIKTKVTNGVRTTQRGKTNYDRYQLKQKVSKQDQKYCQVTQIQTMICQSICGHHSDFALSLGTLFGMIYLT